MSHGTVESLNDNRPVGDGIPPELARYRIVALVVGLIGLGLFALGFLGDPGHAYRSWMFAWIFWLAIPLGCLTFTMMSHMTGGEWGVILRRFGEAASLTLPLLLVLFLPLYLGFKYLFPWAMPLDDFTDEKVRHALIHRHVLYNPTVFFLRTILYFVIWIFFAVAMRLGSLKLDRMENPVLRRRLRLIAAPGVLLYFITITGFAFDYILSRETNWYSTIIGFIIAIGQGASGMAFMTLMVCYFANRRPIKDVLRAQHLNDYGNLLFALVILWMYTNFAQLLVIWQGNTKEDIGYYTHRGLGVMPNGWRWVALLLLLGHFFLPFFLLLMRALKRKIPRLATICIIMLVMRAVDYLWLLGPSGPHRPQDGGIYWTDLVAFIGVGGLWVFTFLSILPGRPILPENATDQPESLTDDLHSAHAPEPA